MLAAASIVCTLSGGSRADDPARAVVELRDGGAKTSGTLLGEGADGIELAVESAEGSHTQFLRWDQVFSLTTPVENAARAPRIAAGERVWRGRSRLSRGDLRAAREVFQQSLEHVDRAAPISRMLVNEGLARTATAAPDLWTDSLEAALSAASWRARISVPDAWLGSHDAFDVRSGLMLAVAPAWLDGAEAKRAREQLAAAADRERLSGDHPLAQLLTLAARIAAADAGTPEKAPARVSAAPPAVGEDPRSADAMHEPASTAARAASKLGLRLLTGWADAVSADAPARKRGRETLQAIARSESGPVRMWAIYAVGRSLAMDDDADKVRSGVGMMLTIPAAYASEAPRLADAALVQSTIALERIHDDDSAAALRAMRSSRRAADQFESQSTLQSATQSIHGAIP